MATSTEVIRRGHDAFASGDVEVLANLYADDARSEGYNSTELPDGGTTRASRPSSRCSTASPSTGTRSARPGRVPRGRRDRRRPRSRAARAGATGRDIEVPFVRVFRMREAQVIRQQVVSDTLVMADALGLR